MFTLLAIFLASLFFIGYSSSALTRLLTNIARHLHFSEYTAAFIFMSIATSTAELFVGISAAMRGIPAFSLGNIIGANIINITLLVGIAAIVSNGLGVTSKISRQNFFVISGLALFPVLLAFDGVISRPDGLVLLLLLFFYLWSISREREHFTKSISHVNQRSSFIRGGLKSFFFFALAAFVLMASSAALVWSGGNLAKHAALSVFVFGMFFVAIGTALPEIAFSIRAAYLRHPSMAIGNALGSVAFTAAGVVGIVSILQPIVVKETRALLISGFFLFLALIFFNVFAARKKNISRNEGIALVCVYLLFVLSEYVVGFLL